MKHPALKLPPKPTIRGRIVAVLTQEILHNPESKAFLLPGEYPLCRRFGASRVTVRLALADLEYKGLIYRRHGKGTFAYGRSTRVHRSLGILIKSPDALMQAPLIEIIRGVQAGTAPVRASIVLINASPLEWPAELASSLGAVIVVRQDVAADELEMLAKRNLPFLCLEESHLAIADYDFFSLGQRVAEALNQVALSGEPTKEIKFHGTTLPLNIPAWTKQAIDVRSAPTPPSTPRHRAKKRPTGALIPTF